MSCRIRSTSPDAFVDALEALVRDERYALLVPGTDATLFLVSAARERLERHVALGLPPHEAVVHALDKIQLLRAAEAVGIPFPTSVVCEGVSDAVAAAETIGLPLILKPASSVGSRGTGFARLNASVVESQRQLEAESRLFAKPFIAQRYETDATVMWVGGVAVDGECITASAALFGRAWPPGAGQASFAESLAPPPAVMARVTELIRRLGWQGLFQLQLLQPVRTGHCTRSTSTRGPGRRSGSTWPPAPITPRRGYAWLIDGKMTHAASAPGFHLRWEEGELRNIAWNLRAGYLRRAAEILAPTQRVVYAHLRLSDPLPFAAWAFRAAARALP